MLVAGATRLVTPLSWPELAPVLLLMMPIIAVYSLSTFGEEVAWRGHLQQLLAGRNLWTASAVFAGVWVLFHVPLHGTLALQGTLPRHVLVGSTLLPFPLGLFLSAAVRRFGSVWPAVSARALPMSALNLVQDPDGLASGGFWAFTALSAAALFGAALLLAPRTARTAPMFSAAGAGWSPADRGVQHPMRAPGGVSPTGCPRARLSGRYVTAEDPEGRRRRGARW